MERKGYVLVVSSSAAYAPAPGLAAYNASKAGVEHFANALRVEVGYRGVAVGSAHMSWIDTPLVDDAKKDLTSFQELLEALPGPMRATTSADAKRILPLMDEEVARLGRSASERVTVPSAAQTRRSEARSVENHRLVRNHPVSFSAKSSSNEG